MNINKKPMDISPLRYSRINGQWKKQKSTKIFFTNINNHTKAHEELDMMTLASEFKNRDLMELTEQQELQDAKMVLFEEHEAGRNIHMIRRSKK